jgi:aminoglycoside phosphotransferase family enzyme
MTSEQVQNIVAQRRFPGDASSAELQETHISWIILTPEFAFKMKKPLQFSFLDFSTLEKREFFCQEELRLNRRLAPDMYLDVLPIALAVDGIPEIGATNSPPIDFAVRMKRMDDSRQMDKLLLHNAVHPGDMEALAALLASFHQSVVLPAKETSYRPGDNRADFDDLFQLEDACAQLFGSEAITILTALRNTVDRFLDTHEPRLHARAVSGFWVDGHGDLHGRNIFLLPEGPVVFDCIEFNPHFRKLDVLNDLAFLCMDLDAGGRHELGKTFMNAYLQHWACIENPEDQRLFQYFKAYRANVRLKVTLIAWQQHRTEALEKTATVYWDLLRQYLDVFLTAL